MKHTPYMRVPIPPPSVLPALQPPCCVAAHHIRVSPTGGLRLGAGTAGPSRCCARPFSFPPPCTDRQIFHRWTHPRQLDNSATRNALKQISFYATCHARTDPDACRPTASPTPPEGT